MKLRFLIAAAAILVFFFVASSFAPWLFAAVGIPAILVIHGRASRGLRESVEARSRDLRQLPFDVLAVIEGAEAENAEYTTTGFIEVLAIQTDSDTLQVVVRGSADVLFYRLVRFDGFYATRAGNIRPMEKAEYDAFD